MNNKIHNIIKNLLKSTQSLCVISGIALLIQSEIVIAQLTTDDLVNPQQLVNNLVGAGVQISNVSYTGDILARGTFNGSASNIGLTEGIILSTGKVSNATGPNDDPLFGSANWHNCLKSFDFGTPGDTDLEVIEGCTSCTHDASILEFDFIPESTTLTFEYVFASEEYPFYVCSGFNDVFAFFLSGQNPTGGTYNSKNIAFIPSTTIPVAINSVNNGTPGYDSICKCYNDSKYCTSLAYSSYFVDNGNGSAPLINTTVQYNGFTKPFTATIDVIPCTTYHIKLAIADVADGKFDSAVLLEKNSFKSTVATISKTFSNPIIDTIASACNDIQICFSIGKAIATDMKIPINFKGSNADTTGNDFIVPKKVVTITAGQTTACINIHPVANNSPVSIRKIQVNAKTSECSFDSIIAYLKDYINPSVTINPTTASICPGDNTFFTAIPLNGDTTHPYTYIWSNGSTANSLTVSPATTKSYTVTVKDACGNQASSNIIVKVNPMPTSFFTISPSTVCINQQATIIFTGSASAGATYEWDIDGDMSKTEPGPYEVSWNSAGTKIIKLIVTDNKCISFITTENIIVNAMPIADFTATNITGCLPLTVNFTDRSQPTVAGTTYLWSFGDGETSTDKDPVHTFSNTGLYDVTFTVFNASFGCSDTKVVDRLINVYPKPKASYYVEPGTVVSELNSTVYFFSNSTGNIISYNWKLSDTALTYIDSSFIHNFTKTGIFDVSMIVENNFGCIDSTTGKISVKPDFTIYVPNAFIPVKCIASENCTFRVYGSNINEFLIQIYNRWGAIVYQSEDIKKGWDGKVKDQAPVEGTYVYRIYYRDVGKRTHILYGSLTLLR